jgi:hypothetical protein
MLIPLGILAASGAGVASDYELISTTILGSTATSVTFSNLGTYSSTYKHLQIRGVFTGPLVDDGRIRVNGSSTAADYYSQKIFGNNTTLSSQSDIGTTTGMRDMFYVAGGPSPVIVDVLNPYDTTKYTTFRSFWGAPSQPFVGLSSGLFNSTASVTSILMSCASSFNAGSRFSLYGIKG